VRIGRLLSILLLAATWAGCGTTRFTDTARTATEQLLITDSIDRAVSRLDFRSLAGKRNTKTPARGFDGIPSSGLLEQAVRRHLRTTPDHA